MKLSAQRPQHDTDADEKRKGKTPDKPENGRDLFEEYSCRPERFGPECKQGDQHKRRAHQQRIQTLARFTQSADGAFGIGHDPLGEIRRQFDRGLIAE